MSEEIKCSKEKLCKVCQKALEKTLAKHEDWEVNCKKYIEKNQMYTHHVGDSIIQYSITGGYSYIACPHNCGKMSIKKNDFGDQTEIEHECQTKSTQFSNKAKTSSKQPHLTGERESNPAKPKNYLPWILGGIGLVVVIAGLVWYFTRKENK
ncbi:hypothetical protein [endosymbiont GvMRE of Glomus versiforme]|uniref:hypothetical protein n=1 Tax=endosymbiont GvMRE of Glomus versiforme TaxID=2039283 RepID=UPI000EC4E9EA|nr:hypothetical protein [endosymbiont GvMRE of Glomus versiforme]RHZ37594.1 hypothetical protein GvMRE_I1g650 [endosymbiont GvMRE of Glomus versiforme]